jgi:DNA-binding CsgD family transcriptional regulator
MSTRKYNTAYSIDVLRRMYDEKALAQFHDEYVEHCKSVRHAFTPTKRDMRALTMYREGMTVSEIAQKLGAKHHQADAMVNRASRYIALGGELSAIMK